MMFCEVKYLQVWSGASFTPGYIAQYMSDESHSIALACDNAMCIQSGRYRHLGWVSIFSSVMITR